jgi:multiple sugar transport system permease protein
MYTLTRRQRLGDVITYLAFLTILLFFGGPLVWILSLSFRGVQEIFETSLKVIPDAPTLENYTFVLTSAQFPIYLTNSARLALLGSIGAMAAAAPAAYAASRLRFRGQASLMVGVLALQMISPLVITIPLYRYLAGIGMLDSYLSTTLVYVATLTPLATWMLKSFFDGIPTELDEAAMVDGCSRFQAFRRVVLPLSMPGFSAVFVLTALLAWAEFVVPYVLLEEPSMLPISVGIFSFQGSVAETATGVLAAGSILAMLPAIGIFVILQRFVVRALTTGALKG